MLPAPRFMFKAEFSSRFARSVWKAYARLFHGPHFVARRMGAWWLLDQYNIIDRRLFCEGRWEEDQVQRMTGFGRALGAAGVKPSFLDIGSHAGFYAVLMRQTGLFSRVLAFEPLPAHLARLHANLALNDLAGRVDVLPLALSDAAATLRFAPGPRTNRGMAHTIDGASTGLLSKTPESEIVEVKAQRLDDLMTLSGAPLVIKIDVEGHEAATITGMRATLTGNTCALQVEILPEVAASVSAQLADLGYRPIGSIGLDHYFTNAAGLREGR